MAIKVVLIEGRGKKFRQPAGRLFAAAPQHTFAAFATRINAAFGRWDISHLHEFELADGTRIQPITEDTDEDLVDEKRVKLGRLRPSDKFSYTFDLGDRWFHECTVEKDAVDPMEVLGIVPGFPLPFFGWGNIPDQYGRVAMDRSDD